MELLTGDTWQQDVRVVGADGAPVDLTGAAVRMQFRLRNRALLYEAEVVILDPASDGELRWTVPDDETSAAPEGPVDYGLRVELADGTVATVMRGSATIVPGPVQDEPVSP